MGSSVEIYLKYAGPGQRLAHRLAEALELTGYFYSGGSYVLPVQARRWIDAEGWGQLILSGTDLGRDGEPGSAEGTAFAPYEYELALEFRGPLAPFGRAIFDRLVSLELPLAYGDDSSVFADFLPGRGVRDFPSGTVADDPGRERWHQPALHHDVTAPWPSEVPLPPPLGQVIVFETDGLLQIVPTSGVDGSATWVRPVAATRSSVGPRDVGLLLDSALRTTARPGADDRALILVQLAEGAAPSISDFAERTVSVEIAVGPTELIAIARAPRSGRDAGDEISGPIVDELLHRGVAGVEPDALGKLVLDLIGGLRARAGRE
jgi:hypothetical protein